MFRIALFLVSSLGSPAPAASAPSSAPIPADPPLIKAFDAWWKAYRRGRIDFHARRYRPFPKTLDVLPPGMLGAITARRELEALLGELVKLGDEMAARRVLRVAATGLDRFAYTRRHAPGLVRQLGEAALARMTGPAARALVGRAAKGELARIESKPTLRSALQAAALRALGGMGGDGARAILEQQLGAGEPFVRLAAADGLRRLDDPAAVEALAAALAREDDERAMEGVVGALAHLMSRHREAIDSISLRKAVTAAINALGRTGWRADMSLIDLLDRFPAKETVPALIVILERFVEHPEDVRSGKLSGLLRHRAHEALVAMTGAFHPIDAPQKWRAFWAAEQDRIDVADRARKGGAEVEGRKQKAGTLSTGFFGIPVRGTRVVFVVDLSGSMNFPVSTGTLASGEVPDTVPTRLDRAKQELARAVSDLPEVASFNMVMFQGPVTPRARSRRGGDARKWSKSLVPATPANKKRFLRYVAKLKAEGGTNTWAGLQMALEMKSLVYGDRYESQVDELFVLSDGLPSVGEVTSAAEILRLVREGNRFSKVRINTVYIADQLTARDRATAAAAGMKGEEFMRRLAEQNGGTFVNL